MKKLFILLSSICVSSALSAQDQPAMHLDVNKNITVYNDALEASQGKSGAHFQRSTEWQSFTSAHSGWTARFNVYTGMPHRAFGAPIPLGVQSNFAQAATTFMQQQLAMYNIPMQDLKLIGEVADKKYVNVNFAQRHQQMEVLFSRATFRFTKDGKLVLFGLDVHNNIPNLNASLSAVQAETYAKNALVSPILSVTTNPEMKILPVPNGKNYAYKLVYEVMVHTQDTKEMDGQYYTLVDANTGEILYRQNKVHSIDHKIKGGVHAINWASPIQNLPLANLQVVQNGLSYYTDAQGDVSLPSASAPSTLALKGLWCRVIDNQVNQDISYSAVLANNDSTIYDTVAAFTNETKVNAYYHVDLFHEFMKSKLPASFTDLDIQLLTRVDRTDGDCNAFYNGNSINFYYQGAGCASTAYLADVLYHEYGHGVTNDFWGSNGLNFDNGAMGEGYSDMWAMSITDLPVIGPGFFLASSTNGIRRYNAAPKVYPADIIGEVHADGEIIAGAWWDTRINIGSLDTTSSLFADSHSGLANGPDGAEGQVYYDILIDALTYDDNDGNIYNGTPHFNAIVNAFAKHGIFLTSSTNIEHTPQLTAPALQGNTVTATLDTDWPALIGDVAIFYRKKGITTNPTNSVLCTNPSGNTYVATLPAAPAGTIYEYYYSIKDNNGNQVSYTPTNARFTIGATQRNLPFLLPIGFSTNISENFEGGNPQGWSIGLANDNATAGKWVVATPVSSAINGNIVQTDKDHTTGTGMCAVTGNAVSANSSVGTADVDGGRTAILTRVYDMSSMLYPAISYWRWFSNSSGTNPRKDWWEVYITDNSGNVWTRIERTYEPDVSWRRNIINVKDYKTDLKNIQMLFIANDSLKASFNGGSLVEAALDDFAILDLSAPESVVDIQGLDVQIYPNPSNEIVNFQIPELAKNISLQIVDATGKLIKQTALLNAKSGIISTVGIADGLYLLHIVADGKKQIIKLRVQH